jgi:hypothetical protein
MYLSIIVLPLLGSIVAGFFGRKVGVTGAQIITSSCVIITTIFAIIAFVEVGFNNIPVSIELFRWIESEWFNISWGFEFDSLTVSMLIPVLIISSLVHIYSISYMSNDPHVQRFFSYLSLFTFMMIILVTGNNYLLMFVGWEGVGVCSYLLVSFWFTRIPANQSSISAFLTNRVGDCFLTIGMFTILWSLGNLDYATVFSSAPYLNYDVVTLIGICLLIGAMAKSSQVGLHVWLPMAMEGPTPVSALIHAATMVTAGVYLLIRSSPLIEYSSTLLLLCLWLGAITTVFSSLIGLFQQDIKKVIAYSTMSQSALQNKLNFILQVQTICKEGFDKHLNLQVTKAHNYINIYNYISSRIKDIFNKKFHEFLIFITKCKLLGTSEAIRLIFVHSWKNPKVYNEVIDKSYEDELKILLRKKKQNNEEKKDKDEEDLQFKWWLGGLVDGGGRFKKTNKGYTSFHVVFPKGSENIANILMTKYGGKIKKSNYSLKYIIHNKKGLIKFLNDVNGHIKGAFRYKEFTEVCETFNILAKRCWNLQCHSAWFSGLFDSQKGDIIYNEKTKFVKLVIRKGKSSYLHDAFKLYKGKYIVRENDENEYQILKIDNLINIIYYFELYPPKTSKIKKIHILRDYYIHGYKYKNPKSSYHYKWLAFCDNWMNL